MGAGIFWGILIILIGISLMFKEIPVFRIIIGGLFIFWGISIIVGGFHKPWRKWNHEPNNSVFSETNFDGKNGYKEYNVIFGKGNFDFRDIDTSNGRKAIKIHTVFAGSDILLDSKTPVRIKANAAFAGVEMPNGNSTAFGATEYQSGTFHPDSGYLDLEIDVVFGSVNIKSR